MNMKNIFSLSLLLAGSMQVMQCHDTVPNASNFLIQAVYDNNTKKVKALLRTYVDVNKPDDKGNTPLFHAAYSKNLEIVNALIEADANVNHRNELGQTPLFCANSVEVAQALIGAGADIKVRDIYGKTILWNYVYYSYDENSLRFFIQKGVDINAQDNHGNTPLHYIIGSINGYGYHKSNLIKILINAGASISIINNKGETALDLAYESGDTDLVLYLINSNAFHYRTYNSSLFFTRMLKQLITDVKGKYISENSACGYTYSESNHQNTMKIAEAMIKRSISLSTYDSHTMAYEINALDTLIKGSAEEQALCAEFQILSKTLSLYNYKKAMKIQLQALQNELRACMSQCGSSEDGVIENFIVNNPLLVIAGLYLATICVVENSQALNKLVDTTVQKIGSTISGFGTNYLSI